MCFVLKSVLPTEQCLNLAVNIKEVSSISKVSGSLCRCDLLESELTVPGGETVFTRAEMKEHSILDYSAVSDLQIVTESSKDQSLTL